MVLYAAYTCGENCYLVGDPVSVSPEGDDSYSFFNVATTAVVNDETLTITFIDADVNDLDNNGDTSEMPTLTWTLLDTAQVEDLNACTEEQTEVAEINDDTDVSSSTDNTETSTGDNDPTVTVSESADSGGTDNPFDSTDAQRPLLTRAECLSEGGSVIGDIGDGAIHQPE